MFINICRCFLNWDTFVNICGQINLKQRGVICTVSIDLKQQGTYISLEYIVLRTRLIYVCGRKGCGGREREFGNVNCYQCFNKLNDMQKASVIDTISLANRPLCIWILFENKHAPLIIPFKFCLCCKMPTFHNVPTNIFSGLLVSSSP